MNQEQSTRESLGGSSRDGERGNRSQRRTASSSGFLVDSFIPRSKSFRGSGQYSRRSAIDQLGKRGASETETTPKKRSRFPWSRQPEFTKGSDDGSMQVIDDKDATGSSRLSEPTQAPDVRGESAARQTGGQKHESQPALGLDKDSLQIVNLALNLSESRRRGNTGYNASNQIPAGAWTSPGEGRASAVPGQGTYSSRYPSHTLGENQDQAPKPPVSTLTNNVLNSLPKSATTELVPQGFSGGTLARAANARRYFELRHEYLRLLPSLPPLKSHGPHASSEHTQDAIDGSPPHRLYNPLQAIRNRKVRFRERCPIDTEADGWDDVERVHTWVNSVEAMQRRQVRSPFECLKLPPFQRGHPDGPPAQGVQDIEASAASPPSSLRRISRTGSLKARRPRSDWMIYPDELLADAAWVEDAQNKTRLVDKDGNVLYPNSASLVVHDVYSEQAQGKNSLSTGRPSSHNSHSDTRRSLSADLKDSGRGRHSHKLKHFHHIKRSSSTSEDDLGLKKRMRRIRPRSSSSSSAEVKSFRGPFLGDTKSPRRSMSPLRGKGAGLGEKRGSLSSVPSLEDRYDPLSLVKMEGRGPDKGMEITYFPSIASNLSAPSSRSSSPAKRGFSRAVGHRRAHSRSSFHRKHGDDDSSEDLESVRKDSLPLTEPATHTDLESTPLPVKASTYHPEGRRLNIHEQKDSVQHESKLRGIFKGPGKIAGKVGNEVSKMGDFILKKDGVAHSRQSSFAISDDSESDEEDTKSEKRAIPKAILRRLPTFSDDPKPSPRNSDKSLGKNLTQTPPTIIEPRQQRDEHELGSSSAAGSQGLLDFQGDESSAMGTHSRFSGRSAKRGNRFLQFGPEIHTVREEIKKGRIKDNSVPFSLARPPVTGLAQAQPTARSSSHELRPTMSGQSRSWSISDRSLSISIESGVPGKQEVERTRALLLSSGIKAREITRRAESVRNPPPEFLQRAFDSAAEIPSVSRLREHEIASRRLLQRIEASHSTFESSIDRVPKAAFSPLKSQLSTLEDLVNQSLNNRIRAAAEEAENLSMQLSTTSTLAVKQLSDTLDHGLRKRHRRLRWLRRTGFVMLEWALIGLLWWVWLIVVAFKLLRKLLHGMVSGVRWILWL
ncbi:hypothetical protein BJY04DRAFT_112879 [Aspergillus karnatakaensis]|uniref:uncharacterized protein n=1 Tax=Aspergillus karnatakaensis TaxID=1810916 RepID=UPI003CCDF067